ncbi:YIP1 family protein [Candidatus Gottesmanbacteria bacterium]|nr:YIP1 family protein [Candidatus Gottesmanbacteria bacterium]
MRHLLGIIIRPYETMRSLSKGVNPLEIIYINILAVIYIGLASLLRKGLDSGSLLLTLHFGKLFSGIIFTFIFSWGIIYFVGKLFGGKASPSNIFYPWLYSLIPTLLWFLTASFFYFLLPPPRTDSLKGQLFSLVFIGISITCFYWKGMLYYLTLRFGHKLSLGKIILSTIIIVPLAILYSLFTYKLGLFRIPFI